MSTVFSVGFDLASYTADEATVLHVKVTRQGFGSLTVNVSAVGITATSGADFTPPALAVTFSNDETEKILSINILNDTVYEGPENFELVLVSGDQNIQLSQSRAVVSITDLTGTCSIGIP